MPRSDASAPRPPRGVSHADAAWFDPQAEPPEDPWDEPPDDPYEDAAPASPQPIQAGGGARAARAPQFRTAIDALRSVYGFDAFRGDQAAVVDQVIAGGDAIVLMPTGGGKSVCYQVPALVREGTGLVVSPADRPHARPGGRVTRQRRPGCLPELDPGCFRAGGGRTGLPGRRT
ncbi:DEAD/DEAH box helicase [Propioniciclava flava]